MFAQSSVSCEAPKPAGLCDDDAPGTIGGLYASPLVNPPEAAIVALGRVRTVPALVPAAGASASAPHTSHHSSSAASSSSAGGGIITGGVIISGSGGDGGGSGGAGWQVVARNVMGVSWGADHRLVDGAALAGLSNTWKGLLEDPGKMMLWMR